MQKTTILSDIINILPDSVANQIAAGEVIQRPASAVKELIENSVDAGSTSIQLIIKEAGKTLIQIIDDGKGMSETDARLCFERHATSKIKKADDLSSLTTKGFRGEALASIAAIAQVEMKTKRPGEEVGTEIIIEGTEVKSQQPCSWPEGTSISIKNLFFNVPARRNFLKSNTVETGHIIDEFHRVALAHPEIAFSLYNNGSAAYTLPKGSLKQRIMGIYGNNYNERLVPVEEDTNILKIQGYVVKPEHAKKTRGEQFFFINNRYIKNSYLHHAVVNAFDQLIAKDSHPAYFLNLTIDPAEIDVNIHPTKTEIKFQDERSVYLIIRSAVKLSLGKFNISPTIDFNQEASISFIDPPKGIVQAPTIKVNPEYNPFNIPKPSYSAQTLSSKANAENWEKLYQGIEHVNPKEHSHVPAPSEQPEIIFQSGNDRDEQVKPGELIFQLHSKYILSHIKSGFIIIDQQRAHERVLYENFLQSIESCQSSSQQLLFPETITLAPFDYELLKELENEVRFLGFDINDFGNNSFVIHGIPSIAKNTDNKEVIEKLLELYKQNADLKLEKKDNIARAFARNISIKPGRKLSQEEMRLLVDELFACNQPYASPYGKATLTTVSLDELEKRLQK